jgi:hypothetical protein
MTNSAEITCKKELIHHYQTQIYKLTKQQKYLQNQLERTKTQVKDYEQEKKKTEK